MLSQVLKGSLTVSKALASSRTFCQVLSVAARFSTVFFTLSAVFLLNFRLKHDSQRLFLFGVGRQDGSNTDPSSSGKKTKLSHDN